MLVMENAYFRQTYGDELYNQCTRFILSFRPDWKNDESITNLVKYLIHFSTTLTIILFYDTDGNDSIILPRPAQFATQRIYHVIYLFA